MAQLPYNLFSVLGTGTGLGGGDANTSTQDLEQALGFARRYDPNASIGWTPEGNQYVNFNNALMPQNALGGHGIEGIARGVAGSGERLRSPGSVIDDPIFGRVTTPQNLAEKGPSMVDILGPLLVGGFAGLAGGGLGMMGNLVSKAPQLLNSLSPLLGGGGAPTMTPQQLFLLQLLAMRNQQSGGG